MAKHPEDYALALAGRDQIWSDLRDRKDKGEMDKAQRQLTLAAVDPNARHDLSPDTLRLGAHCVAIVMGELALAEEDIAQAAQTNPA